MTENEYTKKLEAISKDAMRKLGEHCLNALTLEGVDQKKQIEYFTAGYLTIMAPCFYHLGAQLGSIKDIYGEDLTDENAFVQLVGKKMDKEFWRGLSDFQKTMGKTYKETK